MQNMKLKTFPFWKPVSVTRGENGKCDSHTEIQKQFEQGGGKSMMNVAHQIRAVATLGTW